MNKFIQSSQAKGNLPEMDAIGIFNTIAIDSNCLAISISQENHSYLHFCDTNLVQTCITYVAYPDMPPEDYGLNAICNIPGHRIAGTGFFYKNYSGGQDHWNFLTQDIIAYIDSNCNPTGIHPTSPGNDPLKIYPNPFDDFLLIESGSSVYADAEVTVFNHFGIMIYRKSNLEASTVIETSVFRPGFYIVKIKADGKTENRKILKINN